MAFYLFGGVATSMDPCFAGRSWSKKSPKRPGRQMEKSIYNEITRRLRQATS